MKKILTYKIYKDGYRIFKNKLPYITQLEPHMPYKEDGMTYEEACMKHIEELCKPKGRTESVIEEPTETEPTIHEQITDIEMAIAELYEMMLGGTN